jgi:hypothetical protein
MSYQAPSSTYICDEVKYTSPSGSQIMIAKYTNTPNTLYVERYNYGQINNVNAEQSQFNYGEENLYAFGVTIREQYMAILQNAWKNYTPMSPELTSIIIDYMPSRTANQNLYSIGDDSSDSDDPYFSGNIDTYLR